MSMAVLVALGACAVGPDFARPAVALDKAWTARRDPRVATKLAESRWWKAFKDPTLDHLVELAYHQNLSLQIAGLRIVEARAQLGIATGLQFPQVQELTAGGGAAGVSKSVVPESPGVDRHFWRYQLGFDAVWELDFWGKYRRGVQAESSTLLASVADYYSAIVSLTAEVARTYAVIRTFEVLIELARQNAGVQEQGLRIAEARFRNGATSELDVTQAKTLLQSTQASIPKLQISLQQARNALSTLLGKPSGAVGTLLAGPKAIPRAPTTVAVSVPAELLRRRPDVRSAELVAAAQCARIGVAKADLYPSLSLIGSIGFQANTNGNGSSNLFLGQNLYYSIGPQIVWPFFNYGRITNSVRVQDARFQQLLVGYRNTVLKAAQEVEDALAGFLNSQDAVALEQGSVEAAQRSVEISMVQYREGAVDFQRVLDAQRSLLQQQNSLTATQSAVTTNLIALYKALGGGWETRQGEPVVAERTQEEMKKRTRWGDLLSTPRRPEKKNSQPPGR